MHSCTLESCSSALGGFLVDHASLSQAGLPLSSSAGQHWAASTFLVPSRVLTAVCDRAGVPAQQLPSAEG